MRLRIVSYNIHKGFNSFKNSFVLDKIRESINELPADLIFLQEVVGSASHGLKNSQLEFLADTIWTHYSYGQNSIKSGGHHGNAILSKYPFKMAKNLDLSLNPVEKRGMIHGILSIPKKDPIHVLCTHLSLLQSDRKIQINKIIKYIKENIPEDAPIILAGDFNDWKNVITKELSHQVQLQEAFTESSGFTARSFPSWFPILKLDRIYFRNLDLVSAEVYQGEPWNKLSDHLALFSEFKIKK